MIIIEYFTTRADGIRLFRTYSDQHLRIQREQTNQIYDEAIDVENRGYTYIETNEPIDVPEEPAQEAPIP